MNQTIFIGNLTRDPETKMTGSGIPYCRFTLAVKRRFRRGDGQPEADFIPVICWRGLAELCQKYLAKGRKAAVRGSLEVRSYDDKDGIHRTAFEVNADEVEFLSSGKQAEPTPPPGDGYTEVAGEDLPPEFSD